MPRVRPPSLAFLACVAVLTAASCRKAASDDQAAKPPMTQREKDSVLGQSAIPGARGVQKALAAQDSLNKRTARIDSAGRDTGR